MKKLIALILVSMFALSLTACNPSDSRNNDNDTDSNPPQSSVVNGGEEIEDDDDVTSDISNDKVNSDADVSSKNENNKNSTTSKVESDNKTESGKNSTTSKTETSKNSTTSKNETNVEKPEQKVTHYFNDDVSPFCVENKVNVGPKELYFKDGKLYVTCFLVNGFSTVCRNFNITRMEVIDKTGKTVAVGTFSLNQNFTIDPYSYLSHTYTLSGADIITTDVDFSSVRLRCSVSESH